MNTEISLQEYLIGRSQSAAAKALGVTQGAIWQMLRDKRDIRVRIGPDGAVEAVEVKPIGRKRAA